MANKVVDPADGKTEYPSYKELLRHYSRMPGIDQIGMVLDALAQRPDMGSPSAILTVVGTAKAVKAPHGLKDADGNKIKPRTWHVVGWSAIDHVSVVSVDDTNIEVDTTDKGSVTLHLFA